MGRDARCRSAWLASGSQRCHARLGTPAGARWRGAGPCQPSHGLLTAPSPRVRHHWHPLLASDPGHRGAPREVQVLELQHSRRPQEPREPPLSRAPHRVQVREPPHVAWRLRGWVAAGMPPFAGDRGFFPLQMALDSAMMLNAEHPRCPAGRCRPRQALAGRIVGSSRDHGSPAALVSAGAGVHCILQLRALLQLGMGRVAPRAPPSAASPGDPPLTPGGAWAP